MVKGMRSNLRIPKGKSFATERKALTAVGCEGSFASEGVAFETSGSERKAFDTKIQVNANDFKKLQEEYNTLLFKKHQVWCRSFVIPKTFVGLSFQVHNGSKFVLLKVTEKIVGYRFG